MSATSPAQLTETHISVLVFLGDRAYKLKKPVDLGFLDFSTRERRLAACHREVELNRRLAPDVYLGVADVTDVDGSVADHLVVMRRMPPERRLATLVAEGESVVGDQLRGLARLLADFHARAERSPAIDEAATPAAVLANWEESFAQLEPFVGDLLDEDASRRVEHLVRRYLAGRAGLLERRVAEGHVCDGHGDLQAADVFCLDDGPRALDCIEFNDRFRHADVVADVAFLAMDLDRLGAPELGARFLEWYREFSGEWCPPSLVEHYVAYRAHIRAKVACLRAAQLGGPERDGAAAEATRLLHMALRYLDQARVRLVLVGGLPGTGKSTLAEGVATATGWTVLRSDEVRKELAGLDPTSRAGAEFGEGLYDAAHTERTYAELLDRARIALAAGESVVLDASWTDARRREAARALAEATVADLDEVRCVVDPAVATTRLAERAARGTDASDATPAVAEELAARADDWPEAVVVPTDGPVSETLTVALALLAAGSAVTDVVR